MSRAATLAAAAAVAVVALLVGAVFVVDAASEGRIADGMRVGDVDVGGLDGAAARARVQRALSSAVRRPVTVRYREQRLTLRPERVGARLDARATVDAARDKGRSESNAFERVLGSGEVDAAVAPRVAYSRAELQAFVERVAKRVDAPPKDADIDIRDGKLRRRHARSGVRVERDRLAAALVASLSSSSGAGRRVVEVPVRVTRRPDRTLADLAPRYPTVIAVDRDAKELRLYKRLKLVRRYKIAVGQAGLETAAGRYEIQEKVVNPPWHVPTSAWAGDLAGQTIAPNDPRNPLEARWMGFHDGQGIHGTDDLASLGTAASHGCIRMSVPAVKQLYRQVKVGTPVFLQ